jgi:hypothetical protein
MTNSQKSLIQHIELQWEMALKRNDFARCEQLQQEKLKLWKEFNK